MIDNDLTARVEHSSSSVSTIAFFFSSSQRNVIIWIRFVSNPMSFLAPDNIFDERDKNYCPRTIFLSDFRNRQKKNH